MYSRDIGLLLEDMLDAGRKILRYTENMEFEDFAKDEKTIDAVVRNFEIIGEAANRIDPAFRINHPKIEWKRIRGFRNRIVHDYFGIDYGIVWSIVVNYLSKLVSEIETIYNSLEK